MASIFSLVEQVYGLQVARLRQTVAAIGLPDYAADVLGMPAEAPVLEVKAWLYGATGELIEFVRSIHNPTLVTMEFIAHSNGPALPRNLTSPLTGSAR
jgi:DNA-binding GntR family transcriptional regulator